MTGLGKVVAIRTASSPGRLSATLAIVAREIERSIKIQLQVQIASQSKGMQSSLCASQQQPNLIRDAKMPKEGIQETANEESDNETDHTGPSVSNKQRRSLYHSNAIALSEINDEKEVHLSSGNSLQARSPGPMRRDAQRR